MCDAANMLKVKHKAVIVGAGIAGLSAAQVLCQSGLVDVTVLEAKSKAGGRIQTHRDEGGILEFGANWIHGIVNNPLDRIAREENLYDDSYKHLHPKRYIRIGLSQDGMKVDRPLINAVLKQFNLYMKDAEALYDNGTDLMEDIGFEEYAVKRFSEWLQQTFDENDHLVKVCHRIFSHRMDYETLITGCESMNDVSTNQLGSYDECEGAHPIIPDGMENFINSLKNKLPSETVKFDHIVKNVTQCSKTGKETVKESVSNHYSECVSVTCDNGVTIEADFVIITCSLNVLKSCHQSMFTPALPCNKIAAMNKLEMGTVDKIFLTFDDLSFIPDGVAGLMLFWDDPYTKEETIETAWLKRCGSFHICDRYKDSLVVWVAGRSGEYMETLSSEFLSEKLTEVLKKFLNNPEIKPPIKVIRTQWCSDPFVQGSYTYIPLGATACDVEMLSEPVFHPDTSKDYLETMHSLYCRGFHQPALLFAGEATHPSMYSTAHGAYLTGEREAHRILDYLKEGSQQLCQQF